MPTTELTGRDLDAAIARVCGWTDIGKDEKWGVDFCHTLRGRNPSGVGPYPVPRYSSDLNAAHELGAAAVRLGIGYRYTWFLFLEVGGKADTGPTWDSMQLIAHATAEQRARAFYEAAMEKGLTDADNR